MTVNIIVGDCVPLMAAMEPASVDSCVTDPPYHLTNNTGSRSPFPGQYTPVGKPKQPKGGFMGQQWDGGDVAFRPETWAAVLRVLKPGAHLVAFSGTRTYHRMACAIEDAGFEIRDQLAWVYGSGFPKSHNQPGGWGTALKPAWEPICLARKPLQGTVAANMAAHGTGALNIDGCRVETDENLNGGCHSPAVKPRAMAPGGAPRNVTAGEYVQPLGRWPANIIHDGSEEVLAHFPSEAGGGKPKEGGCPVVNVYNPGGTRSQVWHQDQGSAARFFYCAKAASSERGEGNNHPTVKPIDLMRWLCRLVTPKGGIVLDPFAGSGSTLVAADAEQFNVIGCELSPDYAVIAERRVRDAAGMFAEVQAA